MAGLEDRHPRLVVAGDPVATASWLWASVGRTNPALGRGNPSVWCTRGRCSKCSVRSSRRTRRRWCARFDDATGAVVEPLYRATVAFDRLRLAELAGEIGGAPYETDDPGWAMTKALAAAAAADPDALRLNARMALLLEPPRPRSSPTRRPRRGCGRSARRRRAYPLPGPSRAELLDVIGD